MAERKPIVLIGGELAELPDDDVIVDGPVPVYATLRSGSSPQSLTSTAATLTIDGEWKLRSDPSHFTLNGAGDELTAEIGGACKIKATMNFEQTGGNSRTDVYLELQIKSGGGSWVTANGDEGAGYSRMTSNGEGPASIIGDTTLSAGDELRLRAWTASGSGVIEAVAYGVTLSIDKADGGVLRSAPAQISSAEITAGTETALRSTSPADLKAAAAAHGGSGLGHKEARFTIPIFETAAMSSPTNGSGSVTRSSGVVQIKAETTWGYAETTAFGGGFDTDGADAMGFHAIGKWAVATDDADAWIGIDRGTPQAAGMALSGEGFGFLFKRVSGTITIETSSRKSGLADVLTDITSLVTGAQSDHLWSVEADGDGVRFYVDGTLVADHSTHAWPLTSINTTRSMIRAGVTNRNTTGSSNLYLFSWETWLRY